MDQPKNLTAAFLGPRSDWVSARIELLDVQGLFGGRNLLVTGTGTILLQVVDVDAQGLRERRYASIPVGTKPEAGSRAAAPEMIRLLECAIRNDFATIHSDDRQGVPDEARMRIVLTNSQGASRSSAFWAGSTGISATMTGADDRQRFDALYGAFMPLQGALEAGRPPVHEGPYDPAGWETWVQRVCNAAEPDPAVDAEGSAAEIGRIAIHGGCEVRSEGTLSWRLQDAAARVSLQNSPASEFFLHPDGTEIRDFEVWVPRGNVGRLVSALQIALDAAGPNDHPSTRGAHLDLRLPLPSGAVLQEQVDELEGDRDVDAILELVDAYARSCAFLSSAARRFSSGGYREPVMEDETPELESWIPGLKLLRVYERGKMTWPPAPEREYTGESWVVTDAGRAFPSQQIMAALQELRYLPQQDDEAVRAASACVRLICRPHVFRSMTGSEGYMRELVPGHVLARTSPPVVTRSPTGCEVTLHGYVQAMSGFPEEWVKQWRVRFGAHGYEIEETAVLWSERGRYKW